MAEENQKIAHQEHSIVFMILSDFRQQNKRLSRFAVMILIGWLLTIFAFVGYIIVDRWYDSKKMEEVTLYQTQSLDQNDNSGENQSINMSLEQGDSDGVKEGNISTN